MIWNYDVMMQGTWDTNAGNTINDNSVNIVSNYIDKGKGVLGYDFKFGWGYTSTKVRINTKGFLTQFPWNLGSIRQYTYSPSNTYNI